MASLKQEIEEIRGDPHLHTLNTVEDIRDLPLLRMKQIHRQLSSDLEKLNQVGGHDNQQQVKPQASNFTFICLGLHSH